MKNAIKAALSALGIFVTKNQRYDYELVKVLRQLISKKHAIHLIDIGAHKGEITDLVLSHYPSAQCLLFEPIPSFYEGLKEKYRNQKSIIIKQIALSKEFGITSFHFNETNPAYSGIKQRSYPSQKDRISMVTVHTNLLDAILEENEIPYNLLKIDVEGGEMDVLLGARKSIARLKPTIIFEHGQGASEYYSTTPTMIFNYFSDLKMHITTMQMWLSNNHSSLDLAQFVKHYDQKLDYYFLAYPSD